MKTKSLKQKFEQVIDELAPNWKKNPDMKETPHRLVKMYTHFFRNESPKQHLKKKFPMKDNELIVVKNIECFGMCPHHLIPVIYKVHIGYKPNGWALGLSKLARISIALSSYPKLQENLTSEIAETIYKGLKPKGVIVIIEGKHGCIRSRGVEKNSTIITSEIKGSMVDNLDIQNHFFNLIKIQD